MKILSLAFGLATLLFGTQIEAQVVRNHVERADDRRDLAVDKAQLERDIKEVAAFKADMASIQTAWKAGDVNQVNASKNQLVASMKREIEQSENKLKQDKHEVKESNSEIRSDNREIQRDRNDTRARNDGPDRRDDARDLARDKGDRRDDVRDRNDDVRDANAQAARLTNQKRIYGILKAYNFANLGEASKEEAATKRAMIKEFLVTMENDLAATQREIGEDKGELREDRRETRDDKQERREK
jgi:hypothetical protein